MSELQDRLAKLMLRLDYMGMRVEQAVLDALRAAEKEDRQAGQAVDADDAAIDREEVEIEQECIRLLALYQPAAVDLRAICTVIKANSDLERIADLAASIGRRVKHVIEDDVHVAESKLFQKLRQSTMDLLGGTVRILNTQDPETAGRLIEMDNDVDRDYKAFVRSVLDCESSSGGNVDVADRVMTMINLAKALERIGDLCTNIAEDIIFLRTGDVVRHAGAFMSSDER